MTDRMPGSPGVVDVHCHIQDEESFGADRDQVLGRAADAGVTHLLAMGEGFEDNLRVLALARRCCSPQRPRVVPCLGLHPERAAHEPVAPVAEQIRAHAASLGAIGEVGLDFWIAKQDDDARRLQREAFATLIRLALELDLALSVHSRSAGHQALALLAEVAGDDLDRLRVCMHAFDGAAKHAVRAVEQYGFLFSVPPSVVRSPQKQKLVRRLPLSALLLETDSPVLGPDPGQRNEPSNVTVAAQFVAQQKGCQPSDVVAATTEAARRLFRLDGRDAVGP